MRDLAIGHLVFIHGLATRNDLNNKTGTLIRFHSDAQRWQLQVSGSQEMIRIREINVCRDRIEIIPMNEPVHQILRPAWKNPCDSIESANVAFVNYVTNQRSKTFRGQVFIHIGGHLPNECVPPKIVLISHLLSHESYCDTDCDSATAMTTTTYNSHPPTIPRAAVEYAAEGAARDRRA